jgi:cysteine desulfurase/selenocysteine lyase
MSTSDQDKAGSFSPFLAEDSVGDVRDVVPSTPAGLPDVAALAQMANEFFVRCPDRRGSLAARNLP